MLGLTLLPVTAVAVLVAPPDASAAVPGEISTFAGTGVSGTSGDGGPASSAQVSHPLGMAVAPDGTVYLAQQQTHVVRKVSPSGVISTIAGTVGVRGFSGDGGPAVDARLDNPSGLALDPSGNLYVVDSTYKRVRKIDTSGVITTFAGGGGSPSSLGDGGPATSAYLNYPGEIAVNSAGEVFIVDRSGYRIRKVDISGTISTFAGTGTSGFTGDGGPASAAKVSLIEGMAIDANDNVYLSDFSNDRIRKIDATTGVIRTIAGNGIDAYEQDGALAASVAIGTPGGLAFDAAQNLYVDTWSHIRKITPQGLVLTVAGNGDYDNTGDGGPATEAGILDARHLLVSPSGNLLFSSYFGHKVRAIRDIAHAPAVIGTPISIVGGSVSSAEVFGGANRAIQNSCYCFGSAADPVHTGTGNFYRTWSDISVPGRGASLGLSRTYNAQAHDLDGPFGYGWQFNWGTWLIIDGNEYRVRQENGSEVVFTKNGSNFEAPPRVNATLTQSGGTYTFVRNDSETIKFNSSGQLTSIEDLNGYETTLSRPNATTLIVTDESGRDLTFTLSSGKITGLTDPAGRTMAFAYNSGNLTEVTDVDGGKWTFTYDGNHRMLTMREPRFYGDNTTTPSPVVTNVYDGSDRVTSQTDQIGRTTAFDYTTVPGSTIVTDPKGNKTLDTYEYGLRVSQTKGYASGTESTTRFYYDPYTLGMTAVVDPLGHVTTMTYDDAGNRLSVTDANNKTSTTTYNALNQPTSSTDPLGNRSEMTYDADGNLLTATRIRTEPNPDVNETVTYTYGDSSHPGDITKVTNAEGEETTFTYNAHGDLTSTSDDLGNETTFSYGNPSPLGSTSIGWVASSVAPKGNASGGNPANHRTYFDRDKFGRVLATRDPMWDNAYPNDHRVSSTYDANGNVSTQTDATGKTTTFSYNAANELRQTNRPDSTVLENVYWPDGSLKTQIDGRTKATNYAYDSQGRLSTVTDALSRATNFTYDLAGNLTTKVDPGSGTATSRTTTYAYDANNRQTSINYADVNTPDVTFTYDDAGRRTQMTDGTGTTTYSYDSLNRLTGTTNGANQSLSYGYDRADRQTTITYPGNKTVTRTFDDAGRMTAVSDWLGNNTEYDYDANGNLLGGDLGNNIDQTTAFNDANQPVNNKYNAGWDIAEFVANRNGAGQVTSTKVWGDLYEVQAGKTYQYDQVNRIGQVNGTNTSYDNGDNPTGRVINTTPGKEDVEGATAAITQAFDDANQLTSSDHNGGTTYSYDARGNRTGSTPTATPALATNLAYDQANRLKSASTSGAPSGTYEANVLSDGPTAYWRLNDTGSNITDSSGNGRTGSTTGWFTNRVDGAIKGDPDNRSFHYGNNDAQNWIPTVTANTTSGGKSTVELFMQWDGWNGMGGSSAKETVFAWGGEYSLTFNDGAFGFSTKADGSDVYGIDGDAVKNLAQRWVHVVGVFNNGAVNASELYIDGVKQTSMSQKKGTPLASMSATNWATIAANGSSANDYNGRVDEVSTYDKALTQTDVTEHFKAANNYSATYAYDGTGLRQSKIVNGITTSYLWDTSGGLPVPLMDGRFSWVYGADGLPLRQIDSANNTTWLTHDNQGNTRMLLRNDGFMLGAWDYDVAGLNNQTVGSGDTPLRFQSQLTDTETGFVYLRARYHDPKTNQFLTVDPLAGSTWSRYGYADGDGVNLGDPSGLSSIGKWWNDVKTGTVAVHDTIHGGPADLIGLYPQQAQGVADFAGGTLNGITLGSEKQISKALGMQGYANSNSGAYLAGNVAGTLLTLRGGGSKSSVRCPEDIVGGLAPGRSKGVKQVASEFEMKAIFTELAHGAKVTHNPWGIRAVRSDGVEAVYRSTSSSGGPAINIKGVAGVEKVHLP